MVLSNTSECFKIITPYNHNFKSLWYSVYMNCNIPYVNVDEDPKAILVKMGPSLPVM